MTEREHERLADRRGREADRLAEESERVERELHEARAKAEDAARDPLVASPAEREPDEGGPEADYPSKR